MLPPVGPVNAMDLNFHGEVLTGASVFSSSGGVAASTFPPEQYTLRRQYIGPMTPTNARVTLGTSDGMSSIKNLPFFFVDNEKKAAGVFVAIGWSGQWEAAIAGDFGTTSGLWGDTRPYDPANQVLKITGGMPDISIALRPGEEISGPRILIGCYRGPLAAGSNRLRRLIRDRYTPLLDGHKPLPFIMYNTWTAIGVEFNEPQLHRLADAAQQIGHEMFVVDAGWYEGVPPKVLNNFAMALGNWDSPDRQKFPSGLPALAEYVRSRGMGFGMWFEPERVDKRSRLAHEHPEWVTWLPGQDRGILDLGNPQVQEYVIHMLDRYITETDMRFLRWDANHPLLPYWTAKDTPDRRGISQIRHIEGLYRISDWILQHHPKLRFEGCASGGQRIDLELARRRHQFWMSDQKVDPHNVRYQTQGFHYFLPGNYAGSSFCLPAPGQRKYDFPDIAFQSYFGSTFGVVGKLDEWPESMRAQTRKHLAVYKSLRKYLVEDYYALTPQPRDLDAWQGWQFHDPKLDEGFVQAFRVQGPEAIKTLALHGLDPRATYRFTDPYTGRSFEMHGAAALSTGIRFELPEMSSAVFVYRRKP